MSTKSIIIAIVVIILIALGGYAVYQSMNNSSQAAAAAAAASSQGQVATTTTQTAAADQVQGQDVKVGTGKTAQPGDTVSVLYVGKLQDGTVFDSSAAHGNAPLKFVLGVQGIIPGFQIGVNGMKEGGERMLAIPAALGYGAQETKDPATGKVIIPANATLIFDIQLQKVEASTSTAKTQ